MHILLKMNDYGQILYMQRKNCVIHSEIYFWVVKCSVYTTRSTGWYHSVIAVYLIDVLISHQFNTWGAFLYIH